MKDHTFELRRKIWETYVAPLVLTLHDSEILRWKTSGCDSRLYFSSFTDDYGQRPKWYDVITFYGVEMALTVGLRSGQSTLPCPDCVRPLVDWKLCPERAHYLQMAGCKRFVCYYSELPVVIYFIIFKMKLQCDCPFKVLVQWDNYIVVTSAYRSL